MQPGSYMWRLQLRFTLCKEHGNWLFTSASLEAQGDLERLDPAIRRAMDDGVTVNGLKEAFSQLYAYTGFPRSLNDYRIERACELLSMGDANVSEVAALCGFRDAACFIKTFKKALGVTPAKWKEKNYPR